MMRSVSCILKQAGYNSVRDMRLGESITRTAPGYMELGIEKIMADRLCVGHYYWKAGDRMSDPEIEFRVTENQWVPVRFTQHPSYYEYDDTGIDSLGSFIAQWDRNLAAQGFTHQSDGTPSDQ